MTRPHSLGIGRWLAPLLVAICVTSGLALAQQSECRRLARGNGRGVFVADDGTVWCWGGPYAGNGTDVLRAFPVHVSNLTNVVAVAAKVLHVLAVRSDGTLWAWGPNTTGDLGIGTTANAPVPVQVSGLPNVVCAATGTQHSLAVTQGGAVWAWGYGNNGRLGRPPTGIDQLVSVQRNAFWFLP